MCLTEEQVWCRYHGEHRHINCRHADCRAEEIRLTLWVRGDMQERPPREPAYSGCSAGAVARIYSHIEQMDLEGNRHFADRGACGACVPEGDKRSRFLPVCTVEQAVCRGLFYTPPRNYSGGANCAATDAIGCPTALSDFKSGRNGYP